MTPYTPWNELPKVDLFDVLEPILMRPAMYLGKKSIIAFGHYFHGIGHLGGQMMGVTPVYRLTPTLEEFDNWVRAKYADYGVDRSTRLWELFVFIEISGFGIHETEATNEARAFDRFAADLAEFRKKD